MTSLPEASTFDPGVYEYQPTDPVQGGPTGVANAPLLNLTNRTRFLKTMFDSVLTAANLATDGTQTLAAGVEALIGELAPQLGFTPTQQGGGPGQGTNKIKLGWDTGGAGLRLEVDATDEGILASEAWCEGQFATDGGLAAEAAARSGEDTAIVNLVNGFRQGFVMSLGGLLQIPCPYFNLTFELQWISVSVPGNSSATVFNFPTSFLTNCLAMVIGYKAQSPPNTGNIGAEPTGATQFIATNTAPGGSNGCYVIAIGY